jgi:hypothetical protein
MASGSLSVIYILIREIYVKQNGKSGGNKNHIGRSHFMGDHSDARTAVRKG